MLKQMNCTMWGHAKNGDSLFFGSVPCVYKKSYYFPEELSKERTTVIMAQISHEEIGKRESG